MDLSEDRPDSLPSKQDSCQNIQQIINQQCIKEDAVSNEFDQTQSAALSTSNSEAACSDEPDVEDTDTRVLETEDHVPETENHEFNVTNIMHEKLTSEDDSQREIESELLVGGESIDNCDKGIIKCNSESNYSTSPLPEITPTVRDHNSEGEFWSGQTNVKDQEKTVRDAQSRNSVSQDSLSTLAKSYEDTEPVYLSGIVDHITKNDENRRRSDEHNVETINSRDQMDEKFSVTNLMSNESMSDMFDEVPVYVSNSREPTFQTSSFDPDELDDNKTNSCSGSGCSDVDITSDSKGTKAKSSLKRINETDVDDKEMVHKKRRKGITFDSVSVYYFPRTQGFTCVPSQGGSTLGMSWNHSHSRKFSLGEHAAEQRRAHKQYCLQNFDAVKNWNETSTVSSEDSDSDEVLSDSEMEFENYNFLQPIPTRERRAMLRAAGIHKIDSVEKDECRSIRLSREFCGCTCQIRCDPDQCVCAQAGIKCQVDRMNFPCSCTRDGCANENGRVEFNPNRVRSHYINTLLRLEMEKKQEDEDDQRNRLLMNNVETLSQLGYSPTLSPSSSPLNMNSNLINFSYHPSLQLWGSEYTNSISSAANRFNFGGYAVNADQFSLNPSVDDQYHHPSVSRLSLPSTSSPPSIQYCSQLLPEQSNECSRMAHFENMNTPAVDSDQDFVIHDLTNGSKNGENEINYNANPLMPAADKNFEAQSDTASQNETMDASAEASEETEKEESDSENFGIIIKKSMVESVTV